MKATQSPSDIKPSFPLPPRLTGLLMASPSGQPLVTSETDNSRARSMNGSVRLFDRELSLEVTDTIRWGKNPSEIIGRLSNRTLRLSEEHPAITVAWNRTIDVVNSTEKEEFQTVHATDGVYIIRRDKNAHGIETTRYIHQRTDGQQVDLTASPDRFWKQLDDAVSSYTHLKNLMHLTPSKPSPPSSLFISGNLPAGTLLIRTDGTCATVKYKADERGDIYQGGTRTASNIALPDLGRDAKRNHAMQGKQLNELREGAALASILPPDLMQAIMHSNNPILLQELAGTKANPTPLCPEVPLDPPSPRR